MSGKNVAASVRSRLLNKARAEKLDFNLLLTRYALERMLYRLSISKQRDQFLLKGALLFDLWFDIPHRPTHDADFLGFGSAEIPHIESLFREVCQIEADDGLAWCGHLAEPAHAGHGLRAHLAAIRPAGLYAVTNAHPAEPGARARPS